MMSKMTEYVNIPKKLFENKEALAYWFVEGGDYNHLIETPNSGIDILRKIPWLNELVIPNEVTRKSQPSALQSLLFDTYYVRGYADNSDFIVLKKLKSESRLLFILGEPGSGKTTLLNYWYLHSKEMADYRVTHYIIIITCNKGYETSRRDLKREISLEEFVSSQLSNELNLLCKDYNCTEEDIYKDAIKDGTINAVEQAMIRYKKRKGINTKHEADVYLSLLEGLNYNARVLKWFEKHHPELTIDIVVDNLDCFGRDERNDCIDKIIPMYRRSNTKLIIPMRYGTMTEYSRSSSVYQYSEDPEITMHCALFRQVLEARLSKLPTGLKLNATSKRKWQELMPKILSALLTDEIMEFFNGVFGEDNRPKLIAVKISLQSQYLNTPADYRDRSKIIRALMLGEYWFPFPESSMLINLFNNEYSVGYQNSLVRIRLLQFIEDKGSLMLVPTLLIPELAEAGYNKNTLKTAINALLEKGLLVIDNLVGLVELPENFEHQDIVLRVTSVGQYYLSELIKDCAYISLVAQSSIIRNSYIRKCDGSNIIEETQHRINQQSGVHKFLSDLFAKYGNEPFVSKENFLKFLCEEEEIESQRCGGSLSNYSLSNYLTI